MQRTPRGPLRTFVERLWIGRSERVCEHVVPTGTIHVAVRVQGPPVRVDGRDLGHAVIGGPRSQYFLREVATPSYTVGAMLVPGAAFPLLGVSGRVLAERHVALADVWGDAASLIERIGEARTAEAALDVLEAALVGRLGMVAACEIDPLVAYAARALEGGASVGAIVDEVGFSHRHVASVFREHVGLSPKRYARVRRVVHAIGDEGGALAQVAARAGFADQAHLTREVRAIAGVTPREVRRAGGLHVPRSESFKTG
jgi:AraC-like DNA-binding protein